MTHFEFVQTATDLLFETREPARWLASYDAALASQTDERLAEFVSQLQGTQHSSARLAA